MININLDTGINSIAIEKLRLTRENLIKIKEGIKAKDLGPFMEKIGTMVQLKFGTWVKKEYPSLVNEKEDLIKAILRRLKNEIIKHDFDQHEMNFDDQLLKISKIECESNLPTEANKLKNFGLTKVQFKSMVSNLQQGKEDLIEKVFLSEFQKCISIIIKRTACSEQMAYDCTMDALIEIRKDLINDKVLYGNLGSYFVTKSLNKFFRKERNKKIEFVSLSEEYENLVEHPTEDETFSAELSEIVKTAIEKLGQDCKTILKLYYYDEWSLQDIALEIGKGYDAIRKQATRCRDKFKSTLGAKSYLQFKKYTES